MPCLPLPAGNPSVLNSFKDVVRLATLQRPPTVPHTILDGISGVLKPGAGPVLHDALHAGWGR